MTSLRPLQKISLPDFTIFDRDGLTDELVAKVKQHPEWNELWDGELEQNGSMMIINFFSYLFSKNAEAFSSWLKESILIYADDPRTIVNQLASFGLYLPQNRGASVDLTAVVNPPNYIFGAFPISPGRKLVGTDLEGNDIVFEIYPRSSINPSQPDYLQSTVIEPEVNATLYQFSCVAFAGLTKIRTITITEEVLEKFIIGLDDEDIVDESIEIIYDLGGANQTRLLPVKSFVKPKSYNSFFTVGNSNGIPQFKVIYDGDGRADIVFGTKAFGGDFPASTLGKTLTVFYRVGGGLKSNIQKNGINTNIVFEITPGSNVSFEIKNNVVASGGADRGNVFEEQFYAPYRIGKPGAIVTDGDALDIIRPLVSKHVLESPKYSETSNKVNILHTNSFVVPFRNFLDFALPTPFPDDNISSYTNRFLKALQTYCNPDGIHDGIIENEFVAEFIDSDFSYVLKLQKPLNGTLFISAFDESGTEIDRLYFRGNYQGSDNLPTPFSTKAFVRNNEQVQAVTITTGNNRLLLQIDENIDDADLIASSGLIDLTLISASYGLDSEGKNSELANEIDRAIKEHPSIDYYAVNFPNHKFAYIDDDGFLVIESPTSGEFSLIRVVDNVETNASALQVLGLTPQFKRAEPESGLIFSQESRFNFVLSALNILFNRNRESTEFTVEDVNPEWPDISVPTGEAIEVPLQALNEGELDYAKVGSTIVVTAFSDSNVELDKIEFKDVQKLDINAPSLALTGTGNVFDINNITNYDWFSGGVTLKLNDDDSDGTYIFNAYLELGSVTARLVPDGDFPRIRLGQEMSGVGIQTGTVVNGISQTDKTVELSLGASVATPLDTVSVALPVPLDFDAVIVNGSPVLSLVSSIAIPSLVIGSEITSAKFPAGTTIIAKNPTARTVTLSNLATGVTTSPTAITVTPSYSFPSGYGANLKIKVEYTRKLWNFVTATYKPNPYFQEGEAGSIIAYLRASDKRMIGLEPLIKKVNFIPVKAIVNLTPIPGADRTTIRENTFDLIETYFGFNNADPDQTIGAGFSRDRLKAYITDSVSRNPGVNFGEVLEPAQNSLDVGKSYYFIFNRSFISRLMLFEEDYSQISGFYRQFEPEVIVSNAVIQ